MKISLMQPYFFPYLGYFDLINCVDKWYVFDSVQHIRYGWIHRNRILHPTEGWRYIIVPCKRPSHHILIKDVKIDDSRNWRRRIIGQLDHYKKRAPFFHETKALVDLCLSTEEDFISRLNVSILDKVCRYIGIRFDYSYFSELDLELGRIEEPGDWGMRAAEALGADEFVNPPGGASFLNEEKFRRCHVKLTIRRLPPLEYYCKGYEFIPNLSIIDLLMWNSPETIKQHLDKHK